MINHQVRISQINRSAMLQTFKPQYIDLDKFMEKSHITVKRYYIYNHLNLKNVEWKLKKSMNCKSSKKKYELQIIACNKIVFRLTQMIEIAKQSWREHLHK